ncbi:VOC family protein [Cryptosporangium phraense]|uniref:VOC family protein n=1 Tax=Cryptosporangium phraense TaxID=2593070 RepID=A0A545APH2_9ACTN|nr:VOC family protein [Cryptosporangium phraense]TQS43190.1 VOC family protein [Cryptosporangium phraense]
MLDVQAVDHVAVTVPDLDDAVSLLTDVFGARELYRRVYAPRGDEMVTQFNAHAEARYRLAKLRLGGTDVEVFEYTAPDQRVEHPRNADVGGGHLGLRVPDIDAAVAALADEPRIRVLGEIQRIEPPHPLAGRRWIYLLTSWGLQLELVS